jgi:hypothetical protein
MTREDGELRPTIPVLSHDDPVTQQTADELKAAIRALPEDKQSIYGGISPEVRELRHKFGQNGANRGTLDRVLAELRTEQADKENPIK